LVYKCAIGNLSLQSIRALVQSLRRFYCATRYFGDDPN